MSNEHNYYMCKKCNIKIKVKTFIYEFNTVWNKKRLTCKKIEVCPHCNGNINIIDQTKYNTRKYKQWISLIRNNIELSIKFM